MTGSQARMNNHKTMANCGLAMAAFGFGSATLLPGITSDETRLFLALSLLGLLIAAVGWVNWIIIKAKEMGEMKRFEEVSTTYEKCVHRECDVCGKEIKIQGVTSSGLRQEEDVTVKCTTIVSGVDYGDSTTYEVDVCAKCFLGKLLPFINSQRKGKPIEGNTAIW